MSKASGVFVVLAAGASALAACGGGAGISGANGPPPAVSATCHPPSPGPTPIPAWLAYPPRGSTNVSANIGEIIETGADAGQGVTITVSSPAGNVPLGTPTVAPSPYPTPFATPSPGFPNYPYMAIPLPMLSPSTTYTVSDTYMDYDPNNPPQCSAPATQFVGTFTTQ